jgi:hypothetical protein
MRIILFRVFHGLLSSVLLLSCSSGNTGPVSGILNVTLSSIHNDDGAVLFTISGGPVESVEAVSGTLHRARIDANTMRVVVTGNLGSGRIARVRVADLEQSSSYTVVMSQVAARSSYEPRDLGEYSISLAPESP